LAIDIFCLPLTQVYGDACSILWTEYGSRYTHDPRIYLTKKMTSPIVANTMLIPQDFKVKLGTFIGTVLI
jgi:hypothetical protein